MKDNGFTLLELAIVLAIIGLIAGGIVAGSSMIRAAELRAVLGEYQQYQTAVHTFQEKYSGVPGDLYNATMFWGTAAHCPGTATQPSTDTATCNGNADGSVEDTNAASNEAFRMWQHLSNAGLISGNYTGVVATNAHTYSSSVGLNIPESKISGAGYYAADDSRSGHALLFDGDYGPLTLLLGGQFDDNVPGTPIFTPEEAWSLDKKVDDGIAGQGNIFARRWDTCTDAANSADLDADYLLQVETFVCPLYMRILR